jgi:hypothetical protein
MAANITTTISTNPIVMTFCSITNITILKLDFLHRLSLLPANVLIVASEAALHFIDRAKDYDPESWKNFEKIGGKDIILSDDMVGSIPIIE